MNPSRSRISDPATPRNPPKPALEYYEHNPGDHEDPVAGPTWLMGLVGTILLVVIIFGLTAMYYNAQARKTEEKLLQRDPLELRLYRQQQEAMLTGEPRWVVEQVNDMETRRYVIPIDQAMDRVVQESSR